VLETTVQLATTQGHSKTMHVLALSSYIARAWPLSSYDIVAWQPFAQSSLTLFETLS